VRLIDQKLQGYFWGIRRHPSWRRPCFVGEDFEKKFTGRSYFTTPSTQSPTYTSSYTHLIIEKSQVLELLRLVELVVGYRDHQTNVLEILAGR